MPESQFLPFGFARLEAESRLPTPSKQLVTEHTQAVESGRLRPQNRRPQGHRKRTGFFQPGNLTGRKVPLGAYQHRNAVGQSTR